MAEHTNTDYTHTELIFGLVGAVGTNLKRVETELTTRLKKRFSYNVKPIILSELLPDLNLKTKLDTSSEFKRIDSYMTAGDEARESSERNDVLALMAMSRINFQREGQPHFKNAYILSSLKHPDEVHLLRTVYGLGFWLIGVHSSISQRLKYLRGFGMSKKKATHLMERDYLELDKVSGQQVSKTFHRADVFIKQDETDELNRFLDLLFGYPFITPTKEEQSMFIAHAAAIRSGSLSRQVGAVIVNEHGDLIAVGTNEVPNVGGGLFWVDKNKKDVRDYTKDLDPSTDFKNKFVDAVVGRLTKKYSGDQEKPILNGGLQKLLESKKMEVVEVLKDSELQDLTEFQRAVHAEMEALLSCARSGVSPRGGTVYTTVFPCHICAKHIVAAGIKRIVYIEPYPKSRAMDLLEDFFILDEESKEKDQKICMEPFVGIGPRRYVDLFSMVFGTGVPLKRKHKDGKPVKWALKKAQIRLPMMPNSYIDREGEAVKEVSNIIERLKI